LGEETKSSDAAAAFDHTFAFEGSESVTGGHEADFVEFGQVALGLTGSPGRRWPASMRLANSQLNALVGG
jgi:hypothetical protein